MKGKYLSDGFNSLWWIPLITGLIGIALGVWTLCSPVSSIATFALVFAICMAVAGFMNVVGAFCTIGFPNWGWMLAMGILEVIAAIWMFSMPEPLMMTAFVIIIGVWILVSAINGIAEACMMSRYNGFWMIWMILLLLATVTFSILFLTNPVFGGVAVWLYLGISLICFGVYRIILAFVVRRVTNYL